MKMTIISTALALGLTSHYVAATPAKGSFIASQSCDMYQSKRKGTNPGSLESSPGETYPIIEVDAQEAHQVNWVRVKTTYNPSPDRWVSASCGDLSKLVVDSRGGGRQGGDPQCHYPGIFDSHVLAISWQPAFCEFTGRNKPECKSLTPNRWDASHFTLHGYWPNKKSCGRNYGSCGRVKTKPATFCDYPALDLAADVRARLGKVMPSEASGTCLQRHEWWKHGTCSGLSEDNYFTLAMNLLQQVNESGFVSDYIDQNIGKQTDRSAFQAAFDKEFGEGSYYRVALQCKQGILTELQIALPKDVTDTDKMKDLLSAPGVVGNGQGNCPDTFGIDAVN
ncbi:ribonuclease T [Pseudoalteromonas sp. SCSIO 43201]|uniref:ribonuclease T2 family protein n=1 Tax=Pseudoalteromonas sp. SCSIO 43201 TaxID=2822842 RepID=UPI002075E515|nr:ribonuclease T [Pseudoalteromonas sp. SCSIO 43201]USD27408.1 ribonuclease T [Pseudoalteromonas sp. SCSIO 43201]